QADQRPGLRWQGLIFLQNEGLPHLEGACFFFFQHSQDVLQINSTLFRFFVNCYVDNIPIRIHRGITQFHCLHNLLYFKVIGVRNVFAYLGHCYSDSAQNI
ncbi:MAG: hypothetical protein IKY59_01905, partial [Oscillospiraceae bacterium]|nr:hypothetical protein [Oscillospiraceae bacterium]